MLLDDGRGVVHFLPVGGTLSWRGATYAGQWCAPDSPWSIYLRERGLKAYSPRPFVWSTDVNGFQWWRRLIGLKPHRRDWLAGGHNLYDYLVPPMAPDRRVPAAQTNLVVHSHALQLVLVACAEGLHVQTLISVGSPERADMRPYAEAARARIGFWHHVYSDGDRWQLLGALGDGRVSRQGQQALADVNQRMSGAGHSRVLTDRAYFAVWDPLIELVRRRNGQE